MGKHWTRNSGTPIDHELQRALKHPRAGDRCVHFKNRWSKDVSWTAYVVQILEHGGVDTIMLSGSHCKRATITIEEWTRMCSWKVSYTKDPVYLQSAGRRNVVPGDGVFTMPEIPDYSEYWKMPEPVERDICGCTLIAPYPTELKASVKELRVPKLDTFTCTLPPNHEEKEEAHWDSNLYIGWRGNPAVRVLQAQMREMLEGRGGRTL